MKQSIIFILFLLFTACKTVKVADAPVIQESKPAPPWVSSRPINGFKYVGVGCANKSPNSNYQLEAKKNALYDLSSEIKVDISSNSVLYTVQNSNNFNENFNSLIKLSNNDNIEGYTLIDSYENDKQYWVYYSLDKLEYANQKAQKKQQIISKAAGLINASFQDEANGDFSSALKKRIQAFSVLTPYLNEEINFDPNTTHNLKNVFDLTQLIQNQMQTIHLLNSTISNDLKPYQTKYTPIVCKVGTKNKLPLSNFPFQISCEDERVIFEKNGITNSIGELQIKAKEVQPINQSISISLSPDINAIMGSDSLGNTSIRILKQFVQTNFLKVELTVRNINLFINCAQKNLGKQINSNTIRDLIQQKFSGSEINLVDTKENADYIINCTADTEEDASSGSLQNAYQLRLARLMLNLDLISNLNKNESFHFQVKDIYGYANNLENAGLNTYENSKLQINLTETLFFLKRKMLVY